MKKITLYLTICCVLLGCDKTENEEYLQKLFIGEVSESFSALTDYNSVNILENIYLEEFDNPATCEIGRAHV